VKAASYAIRIRESLASPPLVSTIYEGVPPEEDRPADPTDVAMWACLELLKEAKALQLARQATTPQALGACVYEQDEKWRAILRRLSPDTQAMPCFKAACFKNFATAYVRDHAVKVRT